MPIPNATNAKRKASPRRASRRPNDWMHLYDAVVLVSRRMDRKAETASQFGILRLTKKLRDAAIVARADFVSAPKTWDPERCSELEMPAGCPTRKEVPAIAWYPEDI